MSFADRILLVTKEADTATAVASALELNGRFASDAVCTDLKQLVTLLERRSSMGVLVDIDPHPQRVLAELDRIIQRFSEARFIVLSHTQDNHLLMEAMQIGARHFVAIKDVPSTLRSVLDRLLQDLAGTRDGHGEVITVLSAAGGCGATTVAINLANEIQLERSEPALLIDLDYSYGAIGTYLGLEGQFGIGDVLATLERIDAQLINTSALAYSEGLHALISPASTNRPAPAPLDCEALRLAVSACREVYRYTVVDAPRVSSTVAAELADVSFLTLVVFQLNVKDIRTARQLIVALTERGIPRERILPVSNRYRKRRSPISPHEARTALDSVRVERLANDYKGAIKCVNLGQPLAKAAPRSALRRDLRALALSLPSLLTSSAERGGMVQ